MNGGRISFFSIILTFIGLGMIGGFFLGMIFKELTMYQEGDIFVCSIKNEDNGMRTLWSFSDPQGNNDLIGYYKFSCSLNITLNHWYHVKIVNGIIYYFEEVKFNE